MREGNIDRMAGAIIGMVDVDPHAIAPLRDAFESLSSNPNLSALAGMHPLARTAIALPFLESRPDFARYLASEACALSHDDEVSRECVVAFLTELGHLIADETSATTLPGPLDASPRNGLDSDARLAWVKAIELNDFSDAYRLGTVLSGVIALVAGARFGRHAIKDILLDPHPQFWDAIKRIEYDRAPVVGHAG